MLAEAYLTLLIGYRDLLVYLCRDEMAVAVPANVFDDFFGKAVENLPLSEGDYELARNALVDFLHGYSLSLPADVKSLDASWRREMHVVILGIRALAEY